MSVQTMWKLQECSRKYHVFFPLCWQAHEILSKARERRKSGDDIHIHLHFSKDVDKRYYNFPTANEVVVINNGLQIKNMFVN